MPGTTLVPVTVSVKSEYTTPVAGDRAVSVAGRLSTPKSRAGAAVPPPGPAVRTVTVTQAGVVSSVSGTRAVSTVPLTKLVVSGAPFHRMTESPVINPVPVTRSVNSRLPAGTLVGLISAMVGSGFSTVNGRPAE